MTTVQASRLARPGQPAESRNPWSATLSMVTASGATATLRIAGQRRGLEPGCPFWVHGTDRHPARQRAARLRPARARRRLPVTPSRCSGAWFVDGFAAAMGELMCAVAEGRAARELGRRRRPVRRVWCWRPATRPSGAASPSTGARCRRDRRPGRGRRRGPGRPRRGTRLRRGLAELEPGDVVPRRRHGPGSRRGVAAPMRFRPGTPVAAEGVQGEGLLVVDPGDGEPGALLRGDEPGRCRPCARPERTATVVVRGDRCRRVEPCTPTEARPRWRRTATRSRRPATPRPLAPPTVWCSWYRYFEEVTAADVAENLRALDAHDLAVDVVQVDDGWSPGSVRGCVPAAGSGRCPASVEAIRCVRTAGRHLAGSVRRRRARPRWPGEHPDWLVGPRRPQLGPGPRSGSTSPTRVCGTCSRSVLRRLVDLGVDYLKLDFLYAGAVPGRRHDDDDRRRGLPRRAGARPRGRSGRTSTWSAAARRCFRASGWSTRCGSRPTPSTRAARTGPRGSVA